MAKVLVNESSLSAIANAIRSKLGSSAAYKPSQMASAIDNISGYPEPTGSVTITQNGTANVKDYASAVVNVQPNLQNKTVTANGAVTADSGYDGLGTVTVNVDTSIPSANGVSF